MPAGPQRTPQVTSLTPRIARTMAAPETCSCSGTVRASRWCRPCASSPRAHSSHWSRDSQVVTHSGLRGTLSSRRQRMHGRIMMVGRGQLAMGLSQVCRLVAACTAVERCRPSVQVQLDRIIHATREAAAAAVLQQLHHAHRTYDVYLTSGAQGTVAGCMGHACCRCCAIPPALRG